MSKNKQNNIQKIVHKASAVLPVNEMSASELLATETWHDKAAINLLPERLVGLLLAQGFVGGIAHANRLNNSADRFWDALTDHIGTLKRHCNTIDVLIAAGIQGKQLQDILGANSALHDAIEETHDEIIQSWNLLREAARKIIKMDIGEFAEGLPNVEASVKDRLAALKRLREGDDGPIRQLAPIDETIGHLVNPMQRAGRKPTKTDFLTLEAVRLKAAGYSHQAIVNHLLGQWRGKSGLSKDEQSALETLESASNPAELIKSRLRRA